MAKITQPWIPFAKIEELVQLEPALLIAGLACGAWLVHKLLLRDVTSERQASLTGLFRNLWFHTTIGATLFAAYSLLLRFGEESQAIEKVLTYIGFSALLAGATVFVKVSRILVFEYLFLSHMRVAVPVLVVNLFTLLMSMMIAGWMATEIFGVRLAPLLATSAIFSLVLGLALQDTLGNLFAGVALQFDKPYEIGDWIEIMNGSQKVVGKVREISWRATLLVGTDDELVTVPNRVVAQAQVSNFSLRGKPIARSQVFRLPYGADLAAARAALLRAASRASRVRRDAKPVTFVAEAAESWIILKLVYFIEDYGQRSQIADELLSLALEELRHEEIELAAPRMELHATTERRAACNEIS